MWRPQEQSPPREPRPAAAGEAVERVALAEVGPGGYRHFGDIPAHQLGRGLRAEIYKLANALPEDERPNLAARLKFSATTVTAALAAGFGTGDFRTVMTRALESRGALYAIQDHLQQAGELGWLGEVEREALSLKVDEVVRALNVYIGQLSRERQRLSLEPA